MTGLVEEPTVVRTSFDAKDPPAQIKEHLTASESALAQFRFDCHARLRTEGDRVVERNFRDASWFKVSSRV